MIILNHQFRFTHFDFMLFMHQCSQCFILENNFRRYRGYNVIWKLNKIMTNNTSHHINIVNNELFTIMLEDFRKLSLILL